MTPGTHCYFDHYQADPSEEPIAIGGFTPLEKVYAFDPVPAELTAMEARHILGGQGNVWTEYMATPEKVEYMAYPRAIALAESLWTPSARKSWPDFTRRLSQHMDRLDGMNVNYAKHLNTPSVDIQSGSEGLSLTWKSILPDQIIHFTRDTTNKTWEKARAMEKTLMVDAGTIYFKSDQTPVKRIDYSPSKIRGASIKAVPSPNERYTGRQGVQTLGDGLIGNKFFNGLDWCAWDGIRFVIDIDFPDEVMVDSIKMGVLSSRATWIYAPESVEIKGSTDHENYAGLATWERKELSPGRQEIVLKMPGTKVKNLRLYVLPVQKIPEGSPGAGHAAWAFIDEIAIY